MGPIFVWTVRGLLGGGDDDDDDSFTEDSLHAMHSARKATTNRFCIRIPIRISM
jgi:hypothetical protein